MNRREVITFLCGTAVAWPLVASAQQPAMPVIGFLNGQWPDTFAHTAAAFREGLKKAALSIGRTSQSSIAGRKVRTTDCR